MSSRREQIDRLIAEQEAEARESYARGWRDAIAALQAKAPELSSSESPAVPVPIRPRGRPPKAIGLVRDAILAKSGLKGVEVVKILESQGTPVIERTVRSCLRRLRENKIIWQRKGRWYARPNERAEAGNGFGEALATPPQ
jgi:plasmid stabilization system protein ParE